MARTPFPKAGCYTSSYPSTQWQEVPCSTAKAVPHIVSATDPKPHNVGDGNGDYSANVTGSLFSVTGSFDSVTGATGESDSLAGNDNFSLQLNTVNTISSSLCDNPNCNAVQQYVYDNPGNVYIQYWLRNHGSTCPSQTVANNEWTYYNGSSGGAPGCFINGHQTSVPTQPITELAPLRLTANSSSSQQSAVLETRAGIQYGTPDDGDLLGIGAQWNTAEFNVFGGGNSSTAVLTPNPGTTIVVRTSVDNGTTNAPSCSRQGATNEQNSLSMVNVSPCCQISQIGAAPPAIVVTESNTAGATSICQCPAGEVWIPNSAACGPPAARCTPTGCASSWEWQYSLTCTGMDVGIVYNGGCTAPTGESENCYAGFDGSSTVSASWGGVPGPPTWYTLGQQASPMVCTGGFGQQNCNVFTVSGLPACPNIPPSPPPLCPDGEKYCLKFSPPFCVPARLCQVQPAHP